MALLTDAATSIKRRTVYLALVLTLLLWASAFVAIRVALRSFTPGSLALLRYTVASLTLAAIWAARASRTAAGRRLPARRDLPLFLLFGLLVVAIYNLGLNYGEERITAGTASFIVGQIPIFTTIMAVIILGERVSRRATVGIGIGFAGTALLSLSDASGLRFNLGAAFVLGSVIAESLYFVLQKPVLRRYRALEANVFATWAGTLFLVPFAGQAWHDLRAATVETLLPVIYLGVFPAAIAYLLWSFCLSRLTVFETSTSLYFLPFLTIVTSVVWLGEWPTAVAFAGGMTSLLGAVVVNLERSASTSTPDKAQRTG
jgi:drug/metabolite transporter (DMT)-like permease